MAETRAWHGRYYVTVVVFGIGLCLGWQWEGSYLDWRCSPVKVFRYRAARGSRD